MSPLDLDVVVRLPLAGGHVSSSDETFVSAQAEVMRLFDECGPGLRRYVSAFGLEPQDVDDVVQEVFVSLFRHLRLGRSRGNLRGWLFKVGHNLALKHRQRTSRLRARHAPFEDGLAELLEDPAGNPETLVADRQRTRRLHAAFLGLRDRDRECVSLRAEGFRYREIASTLKISLGSVAKSLARACKRLTTVDEE